MYYDDIFLQNGFIDMLCKISNQFVERLDVLSFDDVRPLHYLDSEIFPVDLCLDGMPLIIVSHFSNSKRLNYEDGKLIAASSSIAML